MSLTCHWCGKPGAVMGAEEGIPDLPGCDPDCQRDEDGTPIPYVAAQSIEGGES